VSRYGLAGYFAAADLPEAAPIADCVLSTGWRELDGIFKLYPEQFTVITGKPNHGKSTFALNLTINVARLHGMRTFFYAPENERDFKNKMRKIWLARDRVENCEHRFEHFLATQAYVQTNRHAEPDLLKTITWVLSRAVEAVERDHCELVLLDPWNWIERAKRKDELLTDYINECLYNVKDFAQRYEVPVLMVAHPTKTVKDQTAPTLYDIEGSANWANKCDNGLVVVREQGDVAKVISQKVREQPEAGTLGARNFHVDIASGLFTPIVGVASDYDVGQQARKHYGNHR